MEIALSGFAGINLLKFIGLLLLPLALGLLLTQRLKGVFYVGERLAISLIVGLAIFIAITFVAALLITFHWLTLAAVLLLMLGAGALSIKYTYAKLSIVAPESWADMANASRTDRYGLVVFASSLLIFAFLMNRVVLWQNGALATGYLDAWGDLPLHISLIMSFTGDANLNLGSTILAGRTLTYPFMSDFFSAMLMLFGLSLEQAIEWPGILLNSLTLTLLYYLAYRLVRHRGAAMLAPALFILAGGLGFWWFLSDMYLAPKPIWEFLQSLPRRYTNMDALNIHWVNPTLAHLIPQRSFHFGFPMALSIILLWWQAFNRKQPRAAWLPGVLMGLLPLFHTHTFITLSLVGAIFMLISVFRKHDRRAHLRYWLACGLIALPLAAPQLVYLLLSKVSVQTIRLHFGWMSDGENILWFWFKNLGFYIPLLITGLILWKKLHLRKRALVFYLPFGLLFGLCNLVLFSAFSYDSNKVLVYWFLLSLPFVARLLMALYAAQSWWLKTFAFRLLLIGLIFSGSLNLWHEFQNNGWQELTAEEVALAQEIRRQTESRAVFLSAPIHNNLLTLAGRAVVLGYPGHVYSHGLDYLEVEKIIEQIYSGEDDGCMLLRQLNANYIVVGPHERSKYGENIEAWFAERFPEFARTDNYVIFRFSMDEKSSS